MASNEAPNPNFENPVQLKANVPPVNNGQLGYSLTSGYQGMHGGAVVSLALGTPEQIKALVVQSSVTELDWAEMVDSGTTGTQQMDDNLPVGAVVIGWRCDVTEGFTGGGNASATLSVGIAGDVDRLSADVTGSVFTIGQVGSLPIAADALKGISAAVEVIATVTVDDDFTDIDAGAAVLTVSYIVI